MPCWPLFALSQVTKSGFAKRGVKASRKMTQWHGRVELHVCFCCQGNCFCWMPASFTPNQLSCILVYRKQHAERSCSFNVLSITSTGYQYYSTFGRHSGCEKFWVLELRLHGDPKVQVAILQSIYHAQLDCRQPHAPKPQSRTFNGLKHVGTCWNQLRMGESPKVPPEIPWKFWHLRPTVQHLSDSEDDAPRPAGNQEPWVRLRLRIKAVCGSWRVKETLQRKCHLQTLGSLGPSFTMLDRRINHHQPHL